jgi:hypothetical protein
VIRNVAQTEVRYFRLEGISNILEQVRETSGKLEKLVAKLEKTMYRIPPRGSTDNLVVSFILGITDCHIKPESASQPRLIVLDTIMIELIADSGYTFCYCSFAVLK